MRAVVQCIMANRLMALRFFVNCFKSAEATELVLRQRAQILDELADSVAKARHSATPAHGSANTGFGPPDRLACARFPLPRLLLVSVRVCSEEDDSSLCAQFDNLNVSVAYSTLLLNYAVAYLSALLIRM